ncbi:DUF559 domain-containing protein [Paucibacter sp. KBW04]|uniref:DUF559 domain-containing protein n=1 Tax=Paucibacter sp. KBW04 TaxID=2153361 RepID=UPI00351A16BE
MRNRERNVESTRLLEANGWRVMRFWEHEIEASLESCARRVANMVCAGTDSMA